MGINVKRYEKEPKHEEWEFKASTEYDIPVASLEDGGHGGLMSYEDKVLLQKLAASVFPLTLTVTGGGVYRKTTTQTVTVNWSLKQGPDAVTPDTLKINNEPINVSLTSKQFPGITVNTTFRVEATKDGVTKTGSVSAVFVNPSYFGVVESNFTPTPEGIQGLSSGEIIKNSKHITLRHSIKMLRRTAMLILKHLELLLLSRMVRMSSSILILVVNWK